MFSRQNDTVADWQSLTQLYGEMSDGELYELEAGAGDLTEMAQQVLRDEMKKRGLSKPDPAAGFAAPRWDGDANSPAGEEDGELGDPTREFTWKVFLCECEDQQQAWQIREVLRRAGIESWMEGQGYRVVSDFANPRIQVAADQLEQAHTIIASPIPQEIVELSNTPDEEFAAPVCPRCGAEEPLLEGVDPVNAWRCESCGAEWTDAPEEPSESSAEQP
jgi:hypothetical protein